MNFVIIHNTAFDLIIYWIFLPILHVI